MSNKKFISLDNLQLFKQEADSNYADKSSLDALEQTISTKQDTLVSGTNIKTLNNQSILGAGNIQLENLVEITYADLVSLRTEGNLTPGAFYRITDYVTTTAQYNTQSAGHVFDIIVLALENNKLSEEAWAAHHSGDTYFANSKLEVWKLWYCLDNDTNYFTWADATNGKGVIYRMIDEFGNDIPYDFKNILFTGKSYDESITYTNAYTFSYTENSTIKDASLLGLSKSCYNNVMKEYINALKRKDLNFNIFYSTIPQLYCYNNKFEINCSHNTFKDTCTDNIFNAECRSNTFMEECGGNILGVYCRENLFLSSCSFNKLEFSCQLNMLRNSCQYNKFGKFCQRNTFGNFCQYNTFGGQCAENRLGNYCSYNTFGNSCSGNTFGDSSSTIDYCRYNIIDSGCMLLYINGNGTASDSNYLQNVHIHLGVKGASTSNLKTITIPDRNLPYETNVYMDENGNLEYVKNSGIISAINSNY